MTEEIKPPVDLDAQAPVKPEPPNAWELFMRSLAPEERAMFEIIGAEADFGLWAFRSINQAAHSAAPLAPRAAAAMAIIGACYVLIWNRDNLPFAKESILTIVKEARRWAIFGNVQGSA